MIVSLTHLNICHLLFKIETSQLLQKISFVYGVTLPDQDLLTKKNTNQYPFNSLQA